MIMTLLTLIIYLLICGILYALLNYVVDNFFPDPPARMIKVAGVCVLCIIVILLLLSLVGVGGLDMPRLR